MALLSTEEMQDGLREARFRVPPYSFWKHKKGGEYQVLGHEIDTDDGTIRIRYERVGGPNFDAEAEAGIHFSRPYHEWTEDRFQLILY